MEIYIIFIVFNFKFLYKRFETVFQVPTILTNIVLFLYVELKNILITIIQLMNIIILCNQDILSIQLYILF